MSVLIENLDWMKINIFLAILPLIFMLLTVKFQKNILGIIFFVLWFLFIPNTIYLLTDVQYIPKQLSKFDVVFDLLLLGQYLTLVIFGIASYVYSLQPMLRIIQKRFKKITQANLDILVVIFNFIIAFGVALGKFQRVHSWFVFINPNRVLLSIQDTITSRELILFIILFGLLTNLIWFWSKEKLKGPLFHL